MSILQREGREREGGREREVGREGRYKEGEDGGWKEMEKWMEEGEGREGWKK